MSKLALVRFGQARIAPQSNRANRATRNLRESRLHEVDGLVAKATRPCNLRDSRRSRNTPVTMERAEAIWLGRDPYLQDVAVPHHAGGRVASDHGDGGGDLVVERSATPGCCRPSPCRHVLHRGPEVDPRDTNAPGSLQRQRSPAAGVTRSAAAGVLRTKSPLH